tara:strand:- start:532 stop:729 length:198 start_codon:yes stop_codon:yes gene_type:complete
LEAEHKRGKEMENQSIIITGQQLEELIAEALTEEPDLVSNAIGAELKQIIKEALSSKGILTECVS